MKMLVAGVQRVSGKSSKSGADFDMCNVTALVPVEAVNNGKILIAGHGFKVMEIPCDVTALAQFAGIAFPCELELNMEARPRGGKVETVVTGIAGPVKKAA